MKDPNWHNSWGNFNPYTRMPKHQCDVDKFRLDLIAAIQKFRERHGELPNKRQMLVIWAFACQRSDPEWLTKARRRYALIQIVAKRRKYAREGKTLGDVLQENLAKSRQRKALEALKERTNAAKAPQGNDWLKM